MKSNVKIKCKESAFYILSAVAVKAFFRPSDIIYGYGYYYMFWQGVKWDLNCHQVECIMNALDILDTKDSGDYQYRFVQTCENQQTEIRENGKKTA